MILPEGGELMSDDFRTYKLKIDFKQLKTGIRL